MNHRYGLRRLCLFLVICFQNNLWAQSEEVCEIQNLDCIVNKLETNQFVDLYRRNHNGKTSLHFAVEVGNMRVTKSIISSDPTLITVVDENSNTPLHLAAIFNHIDIVKLMVETNQEINQEDRNGETALDLAKFYGHIEISNILETNGGIGHKQTGSKTMIILYLIYTFLSIIITIWVARTLSKNGKVFLVDAFKDGELANSVNHLLVVGFYLINFGYITIALKIGLKPRDNVEAIEILSSKLGFVILILGGMHFFNLYLFGRLRKRTQLKRELGIQ
ncbi:ankyrin repeat domain-containing protein [Leptospira sp. 96542]|nr:ankyrin repeat domain-containing protein [Leptospira sp. 96542]